MIRLAFFSLYYWVGQKIYLKSGYNYIPFVALQGLWDHEDYLFVLCVCFTFFLIIIIIFSPSLCCFVSDMCTKRYL